MMTARCLLRSVSHLRWLSASESPLFRRLLPTVCTQCNHKHTIARPMKPAPEPVNHLYEDPELNIVPEREEYDEIWLHITGYDFVPVEKYTKFVHKFMNSMQLETEGVTMPPTTWDISTYQHRTEVVDNTYSLKKCHRLIKARPISQTTLSLLLDMITRHIPAGVELNITEPDEDVMDFRYVPDADIAALEDELATIEFRKTQV